ncbi:MAG: restriction endonuclease [Anaerolineales bacterium]|nr:restriction endonuclease [Anaerolineales bacterium]
MEFTSQQTERYAKLRRLNQMQALDPIDFERYVGWLYARDGYSVSETVTSGDEGVDLILTNRLGRKIIVQCKRYAGNVGQPVVRDLYGAMMHTAAKEAHLVTSGRISRQAEEWAAGKPIKLVDGHDLVAWANQHRRDEMESGGRNWLRWLIGGSVALALLVCVGAVAIFYYTWQGRNTAVLPPAPTLIANPSTPTSPSATTPALAPTVTLPGSNQGNIAAGALTTADIAVPRLPVPPTLDGNLSEWGERPAVAIPFVTENNGWDGTMDLTAVWWLGWDDNNLYIAVNVADDRHVQSRETKFAYLGDSLEIQLDTDRAGDFAARVSPDDFQYVISPGNFAGLPAEAFRFQGNDENWPVDAPGTAVRVAARQNDQGYTLEAVIPWADMNMAPSAGMVLGAALSNNDIDNPASGTQELMLSHVATRKWRDPTSWGTLTLEP